jgi:hypothetical protein
MTSCCGVRRLAEPPSPPLELEELLPDEDPDVPEELVLDPEVEPPDEVPEPDEPEPEEPDPLDDPLVAPEELAVPDELPDPEELPVPPSVCCAPLPEELEPHAVAPSRAQTNPHHKPRRMTTSFGKFEA